MKVAGGIYPESRSGAGGMLGGIIEKEKDGVKINREERKCFNVKPL